jgi:hypothetical protein
LQNVLKTTPIMTKPTQSPPQDAPQMSILPTTKAVGKKTIRIAPPETGTDAPTFVPPLPMPSAIEVVSKDPTLWRAQPVGGLWTIDQNMTGWLWFQESWIRVSDATESGLMAMMMIAASGKETGTPCLFRQEADGEIHELYVF